jgi:hypothetical protein
VASRVNPTPPNTGQDDAVFDAVSFAVTPVDFLSFVMAPMVYQKRGFLTQATAPVNYPIAFRQLHPR